jgi:hypothetical protein
LPRADWVKYWIDSFGRIGSIFPRFPHLMGGTMIRPARFAPVLLVVGCLGLALPARSASASPSSAAMNRSLPELKFDGVGLSDCVDFLRDVSGSNITVNWKALAEANVQKDAPITVRLYSVPLRKALSVILDEAAGGEALTYYVEDNVIEITTKAVADKIMFVRVYPIEDLILDVPDFADAPNFDLTSTSSSGGGGGKSGSGGGGGNSGGSLFGSGTSSAPKEAPKTKEQRADDLVQLIMATISPEVWNANGGTASIRYFNGSLVVSAPRSVHEALGGPID